MKTYQLSYLLLSLLPLHAYELHEWGTFTTVSGSDGILLTGLQREEEALPSYVLHHPGFAPQPGLFGIRSAMSKKVPLPVANVTVKMETPVIYFHSDDAFKAEVKVGFEGGTISQWFPDRSGGEVVTRPNPNILPKPRINKLLDFSQPYTGSIHWNIEVLSPEESRGHALFDPGDNLQWTRARVPEANLVRDQHGHTEGFLFYRGLGSFDPGLGTRINHDETLVLENETGGDIPYLLVYERMEDGSTRWAEIPGIAGGGQSDVPVTMLKEREAGFDRDLFDTLRRSLAAQGLLQSEADGMVMTWWKSYFEAPGLRVFWVLPESRTEAILPLSVTPAPDKTVRILVGRSEVIRPSQERHFVKLAESEDKKEQQQWFQIVNNDRFGEAYTRRVQSLQAQVRR